MGGTRGFQARALEPRKQGEDPLCHGIGGFSAVWFWTKVLLLSVAEITIQCVVFHKITIQCVVFHTIFLNTM